MGASVMADPWATPPTPEEMKAAAPAASADPWATPPTPEEMRGGPQGPVTLGPGTTGALHFSRHLAFGLGDKITAGVEAVHDLLHDKTGKQTLSDAYKRNLAFNDQLLDASDAAHPVARWVGNGLGVAGNIAGTAALAPGRAGLAAKGLVSAAPEVIPSANVLGRAIQGAGEGLKVGGTLGAVGGYGSSRADSGIGALMDVAKGGTVGAITGGALGALGGAASAKLAERAKPRLEDVGEVTGARGMARAVKPTPEAQTLQRYGVPLTLGQTDPEGFTGEVEEAALRVPRLKGEIKAQRSAAEQGWRDAVLNEARSPIEGPVGPGDTMSKLHRLRQDFTQAYQTIADRPSAAIAIHPDTGEMVNPREAFAAVLKDPTYQADDQDLGVVRRLLDGEANKLDRTAAAGRIKAGDLIDMRSTLREAAHEARLDGHGARAMMYQDAADSLGGGLKATLPERDVAFLNKTDAAYSKFMRVRDAAFRAGRNINEGEFGPKQLGAELMSSYGKKFAEDPNAGGSLRELSRAGKFVFTNRDPLTGHGEKLKSILGATLGPGLSLANQDPATQTAYMEAAREFFANGGAHWEPGPAGPIGRAVSGAIEGVRPGGITDPSVAAMVAALRNKENQR